MAPRPNWKGFLKLSLVSCAVALYPATSTSQRIRFNIINRKTGNRIRNEVVDAETGDPVEQEDRVKGYQFEKGQYVLVEEDELDNVALESTHTIDIEQFVPMSEVDRIYLDESPITSCRKTTWRRKPLPSSATPCARKSWPGSRAS